MLTVRDGIRVPEAIRVLIEADRTVVVSVPELDRAGVADVLAAVIGQRIRPSSVDQIHALTRRELPVPPRTAAGRDRCIPFRTPR